MRPEGAKWSVEAEGRKGPVGCEGPEVSEGPVGLKDLGV